MALFKRAIGICLASSLSAIFWANAGGARNGQNVFPRSLVSCRICHQAIVDSFLQTAHSKTSARAGASSIIGEGKSAFSGDQNILRTRTAGVYFRMERRGADFYQTAVDAPQNRSRTERFDITIGSGRKGQSYLFWKDELLFQLPASYLTGIEKWINSPGYVDGQINFERVIQPRCLECHSASFRLELAGGKPRYASDYELGITCAKCHGEGESHITYQSAHQDEKVARHILNPANFPRDRQLDNCALCHSGAWDPQKPPFTYRPGQRLDEYAPSGAGEADPSADVHGNQVALLRQSRCFRASPSMSCSTCHNVHRQERNRVQLAQKCLSCHQASQCKVAAKAGSQWMSYCIDCHMPNRKSNLIRINTTAEQFAPEYRSHAIGIYRQIAEAALKTIRGKD
jgi:cytochrome c554/c'-like protein